MLLPMLVLPVYPPLCLPICRLSTCLDLFRFSLYALAVKSIYCLFLRPVSCRYCKVIVNCPSSLISSLIVHFSHPADALPLSSCEPYGAASMSLPSRNRSIIKSNAFLSGWKSVSIHWKACYFIWASATTRCIFVWTNASNAAKVYCCILGLIICATSLILCGVSTSGRLLCSVTRMVP